MMLGFVGGLNRAGTYPGLPHGRGIATVAFEPGTGRLATLFETPGTDNPTFLMLGTAGRTLYATSEVEGWHEGMVTSWRVEADGRLTYINAQMTRGSIAAQAAIDPTGRWLLVPNYRSGPGGTRPPQAVAVFPIETDGGIGPCAHSVAHVGSGPVADRQEGPHPHFVLFTADGGYALVADLGIDRIIVYGFDPATGTLHRESEVATAPGAGPRHLAWAGHDRLVATGELDSTVIVLGWDGSTLRVQGSASTLPAGYTDENTTSDIHVSADGRFVYAANRGHDSLAVLSLDELGGLALIGHGATGRTPRHFAFAPSEAAPDGFALVACQDSDEVVVLRRDPATGLLSGPVTRAAIGSAMCVRMTQAATS